MADLNLRKISKLLRSIDNRHEDLKRNITQATTVEIQTGLNSQVALSKIQTGGLEITCLVGDQHRLLEIRTTIRQAFVQANQDAGVNDILAEKQSLEREKTSLDLILRMSDPLSAVFSHIRRTPVRGFRPSSEELTAMLDMRMESVKAGGRVNLDELHIPVLTKEQIDIYNDDRRFIERKIEELQDQLERINVLTAVEIPDDLIEKLEKLKVV